MTKCIKDNATKLCAQQWNQRTDCSDYIVNEASNSSIGNSVQVNFYHNNRSDNELLQNVGQWRKKWMESHNTGTMYLFYLFVRY